MQVRWSSSTSALVLLLVLCSAFACLQLATSVDAAPTSAAASSSYYELLDLSPSDASDLSLLRRAYRRLALQYHPDKSGSDEDRARKQVDFTRMAQAYKVLKSKRLRARYDHLLAQGKVDYDAGRDWDDFDASKGFKRKPKSKAQKEADLQFQQASEIFLKAAEDADEFALWTAIALALSVALLPAGYMAWSRHRAAGVVTAQRKAHAHDLKATQNALADIQADQARETAQRRQDERKHQRKLRQEREAKSNEEEDDDDAEEEQAAEGDNAATTTDNDEWELVDGVSRRKESPGAGAGAGAAAGSDEAADSISSEDESSNKRGGGGPIVKCVLCRKSFKSQQQMTNHENSQQHKKAQKEADKLARKQGKREE